VHSSTIFLTDFNFSYIILVLAPNCTTCTLNGATCSSYCNDCHTSGYNCVHYYSAGSGCNYVGAAGCPSTGNYGCLSGGGLINFCPNYCNSCSCFNNCGASCHNVTTNSACPGGHLAGACSNLSGYYCCCT